MTSVEGDSIKGGEADVNLRRAGLPTLVDLVQGDATKVVAALSGRFDCVFFDGDRVSAPAQLALL